MKIRIFRILLLSLFFCTVKAQELLPFVENYSKYNYKGDNQIWSVVQGNDKAMYFANNHFFLRYDGVKWERYTLPNNTIIRSLYVSGDRIYSGSYKEFGYWFRNAGRMSYRSLSTSKTLFSDTGNEEIWKIFAVSNKIYFQSFNEIYTYENEAISETKLPFQISYAFPVNGEILLASVKNGIYKLRNQSCSKLQNWDNLENEIVHSIEKRGKNFYVFSQKNGVYFGDSSKLIPWTNPLNSILKASIINVAKFVDDDKLVIGTANKGVFIINLKDETFININRENVLINSSVLSIGMDDDKNLWLGLDNGIAHVEINSPIEIFSDNTGKLGSVYSVAANDSLYLLASNNGIFKYRDKNLTIIPNSQGQAWDIKKIDNQFIVGHNEGTFIYKNKNLTKINSFNGGWNLNKSGITNSYLQAVYSGIVIYNNDFTINQQVKDFYKPIKYVAQIKPHEIWAADNYRGLYRVFYDKNFKAARVDNVTKQNKINSDFGVKIFEFRKKLLFLINNKWYFFNSVSQKLAIDADFTENFPNISDISPIDNNNFLVTQLGALYFIQVTDGKFLWNYIQEKYYRNKILNGNIKIFKNDRNFLLNLDDGFLSIQSEKSKVNIIVPNLEVYSDNRLIKNGDKVSYNKELVLYIISGKYGFTVPFLFYKQHDNEIAIPIHNGRIVLNNLNSGNHTVTIYSSNGSKLSRLNKFEFYVGLPWYFSIEMIVLYLFGFGLLSFMYYRWNKIRYDQKLVLAEEEQRHQRKILEMELNVQNDLKIQEYEKHILELQIQSKSSEVAGKSLSIAKQTQMIENIREILDGDDDLTKIKSNIIKAIKINAVNKHEWETFESSITQIHNDFIRNLTNKYPDLTPKDIKLCIYLKMNLSSKEIAPLLNITFRGVELHRYRLRKKLDMATDASLYKFMLSI